MCCWLLSVKHSLYLQEMEDFAQSSGEHGVVVFSLGSMIRNITQERANTIASALAQIPQKVKWQPSGNQLSAEFDSVERSDSEMFLKCYGLP